MTDRPAPRPWIAARDMPFEREEDMPIDEFEIDRDAELDACGVSYLQHRAVPAPGFAREIFLAPEDTLIDWIISAEESQARHERAYDEIVEQLASVELDTPERQELEEEMWQTSDAAALSYHRAALFRGELIRRAGISAHARMSELFRARMEAMDE